jgi:hypothetical protein
VLRPFVIRRSFVAVALFAASCTKRNPEYCDESLPCETPGTICDVPNRTCVEVGDASTSPDADERGPIVMTHQAADLVLGQTGFDTDADVGCTASSAKAVAVAEGNGALYVRELGERVLGWSPAPTVSNAPATFVLGKTSLTDCTTGAAADSVHFGPSGALAIANGKLALADVANNRVMLWISPPVTNGANAQYVLGQQTYAGDAAGNAADELAFPVGVWTDGTRIAVADQLNNRVLLWRTFPTSHGEPADVVLGQPDFGLSSPPTSPTASNLYAPSSVWSDGTRLFVGDSGHGRVLVWNTFPDSNGAAADLVLGQSDFTSGGSGLSASRLQSPHGIAVVDDTIFVADLQNNRVMVWSPIPTTNGAPATFVLGQPNFDIGNVSPPTAQSLARPRQLYVAGDHLWVTDEAHNRLVRFRFYPQQ